MTQDQSKSGPYSPDPYSEEQLSTFQTLVDIVDRLRSPGGCPWDIEQTHASLKRNLLEECYEVLEAIDVGDGKALSEELGDLLVQVAFHANIASQAGEFQLADVLSHINRKLVRRHPHVFGDTQVADAREVERNWERIKEEEQREKGKGRDGAKKSPVDGIPKELPALTFAQLMQDRVGRAGFEWEDISGVLDKVAEEVEELRQAANLEEKTSEMGDLLFVMVNISRWLGIHAEDALRQANLRFQRRYKTMERLAEERSLDFVGLPLADKEELWQEAKKIHAGEETQGNGI